MTRERFRHGNLRQRQAALPPLFDQRIGRASRLQAVDLVHGSINKMMYFLGRG